MSATEQIIIIFKDGSRKVYNTNDIKEIKREKAYRVIFETNEEPSNDDTIEPKSADSNFYDDVYKVNEDELSKETKTEPKTKGRPRKNQEYYTEGKFDNKKYNKINKEKIKAKAKQIIKCECGIIMQSGNTARHKQSDNHKKAMKFLEK